MFVLLISEATVLTTIGIICGVGGMYAMLAVAAPIITSNYGINIALSGISSHEWMLLGFVQLAGIIIGFFPALRAYRQSLSDGMTIRI